MFIKKVDVRGLDILLTNYSKIAQNMSNAILKIGLRGVWMDPYGSVWVRMVPGDLFQGFPGPKPLKIIEK